MQWVAHNINQQDDLLQCWCREWFDTQHATGMWRYHFLLLVQAMGDTRAMEYMRGRRTLEINPEHPVIVSLKDRFDEHGDSDTNAESITELLYETALLTSGFSVESPKAFAQRYDPPYKHAHQLYVVLHPNCTSVLCYSA